MKAFNKLVIDSSVQLLDYLYEGRDFQRFWVLEEIARAPYFAFLSVLQLRESLGLRGDNHIYLMREHFEQTLNETTHLEFMESVGGADYWIDRFLAKHLVLVYYWAMVIYYLLNPVAAYDLNVLVEEHAAHTYMVYLETHPDCEHGEKICEIQGDEEQHAAELRHAMTLAVPHI